MSRLREYCPYDFERAHGDGAEAGWAEKRSDLLTEEPVGSRLVLEEDGDGGEKIVGVELEKIHVMSPVDTSTSLSLGILEHRDVCFTDHPIHPLQYLEGAPGEVDQLHDVSSYLIGPVEHPSQSIVARYRIHHVGRQEMYGVVDVLFRVAEKEPPGVDQALRLWRTHH
jgi:hypothetical protein